MRKEKTVITIETSQRILIRKNRRRIFVWCQRCAAEMEMYLPDEAAKLCAISTRTIYRLIESGDLHFTETPDGSMLICGGALSIITK